MKTAVKIEGKIPVNCLKEGEMFVAYSPVLDLSTCGESYQEAEANSEEAADLLLEECAKKGTLIDFLKSLGCTIKRSKGGVITSPLVYLGEQRISMTELAFAGNGWLDSR